MFKRLRLLDIQLFVYPVLLWLVSCTVLWSLTYANPDKSVASLAPKQVVFGVIGITAMVGMTWFDYRNLRAVIWPIAAVTLLLLIAVQFIGSTRLGATRWIDLKVFQLQPSEVAKLALILVLAGLLARFRDRVDARALLGALLILLPPLVLVLRQPDLGTGLIMIITTMGMIAALHLKPRYIATIGLVIALSLGAGSLAFFKVGPFGRVMHDYQRDRIYTFLDPGRDPLGKGYNVQQAMIAIGNGGIYGRGLGQDIGQLSQLNFLPKAYTDFIFAALAEATGFIGALFVVVLFGLLLWRVLLAARIARDGFGALVCYGYFTMVVFSVLVNVGMNLGIMPVTGIPLPFISAGGTALIINFIGIGILQSIISRHRAINFA